SAAALRPSLPACLQASPPRLPPPPSPRPAASHPRRARTSPEPGPGHADDNDRRSLSRSVDTAWVMTHAEPPICAAIGCAFPPVVTTHNRVICVAHGRGRRRHLAARGAV